jgi:hypothetical protein
VAARATVGIHPRRRTPLRRDIRSQLITSSAAPPNTRRRSFAASLPEAVAVALAVALPLGLAHHWLSLDGDPGRHIRVGETILHSGLFYRDPFSFTKAGAPFVPYEWLSEVLTGLSVRAGGLGGLAVLTGGLLAATYAIVLRTLLRRGVTPIVAMLTLVLAMAVGSAHWHARPHIFTLLGAAVLMALIDRASDGRGTGSARDAWWAAWPMIPLFALWANTHGGFLYGLFVLGAVVVGDRVEMLYAGDSTREYWRGALIRHAAMLGTAACAALLTPSGPKLYVHTLGYLRDSYLVDNTQEYMSPDFHTARFALIALVLVTVILAIVPRRPSFRSLAVIAINIAFSLVSGRNVALFGVVALPLVAKELQHALVTWIPDLPARMGRPGRSGSVMRLVFGWPLAAVVAMAILARATKRTDPSPDHFGLGSEVLPSTFNPDVFPVRAVTAARTAGLTGRLFHEFTWGGYILYAWPEQRVFIDGQTDFYGDSITREFTKIIGATPGWKRKLDTWKIDLALLATESPLAEALVHEHGWRPVYCDSTAVIFRRDDSAPPSLEPDSSIAVSCRNLSIPPLDRANGDPVAGLLRPTGSAD